MKAQFPIFVTLSGIPISIKLLQFANAPSPIAVIVFGRVILVKYDTFLNPASAILVTGLPLCTEGITISVSIIVPIEIS
jgi:hypothetical protein